MITLNLKIKDQDIELTMDEARELYKELGQVFGEDNDIPKKLPWAVRRPLAIS